MVVSAVKKLFSGTTAKWGAGGWNKPGTLTLTPESGPSKGFNVTPGWWHLLTPRRSKYKFPEKINFNLGLRFSQVTCNKT